MLEPSFIGANSMTEPTFLVTNDDSIHVYFIHAVAKALTHYGKVYVVAPSEEQSWVGRRVSRTSKVAIKPYPGLDGIEAWEVTGTPSDSVNIALGHLLPQMPDVVVSGINIGWNAMLPLIYSSGTVAAALEGASWGLPSIALSIHLKEEDFEAVKENAVNPPLTIQKRVDQAALLGAEFANRKVGERNSGSIVYNINFPLSPQKDTPWINTQPGHIKMGSLFQESDPGEFTFTYREDTLKSSPTGLPSDFETFSKGQISLSKLDFNQLNCEKSEKLDI